jgi:predicted ATP-binding protein involved in virulence
MRIEELYIQHFRGFAGEKFQFHPQFNVIVGNNGSGKTAILEALNIAIGSFLLGIRSASTRHIRTEDIRIARTEHGEEEQYPVKIIASGTVLGDRITWQRNKVHPKGRTTQQHAKSIKDIAKQIDAQVRQGEPVSLPLLAYYSTGRLFKERRDTSVKSRRNLASRFRGYYNCLEATSNFSDFLHWFKGKALSVIQKKESSAPYDLVRDVVARNLPGCQQIYYEFDPDLPQGLKAVMEDGRVLPFDLLSDGTRNLLALMADLSYRCVLLNPHFGMEATQHTEGIVLIDELDLHLHPEWQRHIVEALRSTFPQVQFITTTHSPYIIQATQQGELIDLEPDGPQVLGGEDKSLEDIAEDIQDVENPQWSRKRQAMYQAAREYYQILEEQPQNETAQQQRKERLDELTKPFADNMAYVAFLEMERLNRENRENGSQS